MGLIENIKDVAELVQKADNIELLRKVLQLQQAALDEQEERRQLRQRIDDLEEHLRDKGRLTFHDNAYWDESDGPFCSTCFDSKRTRIRLHELSQGAYACRACNTEAWTDARRAAQESAARAQNERNQAAIKAHNARARDWLGSR